MKLWLALIVLALMATKGNAHNWYPSDCCNGRDCRPIDPVVERVEEHATGFDVWFMWHSSNTGDPTRLVHDFIPVNHVRKSMDAQFHICPYYFEQQSGPDRFTRCFFKPPESF